MNLNNLCMGCMKEKPAQGKPCPWCGYDDTTKQNPKGMLPIWTILKGNYLVGKVLGDGGFGITYTGFDMYLSKKVAIKEFAPYKQYERGADGKRIILNKEHEDYYLEQKNKYVEEARILAQIEEQPGVVKVRGHFHDNDTAYIVMEFIEGKSLKSYLKEKGGRLSADETMQFMRPVIKALAGIHEKGIVHRDISPDNIMLASDGSVKLIDFGAAADKYLSHDKLRVYKERYSPPEQRIEEGEIGTYSDIYALCATMYYMITGEEVPDSLLRKHKDTLKPPSESGIEIGILTEAALMYGLELDADERIKNASDLYHFFFVYGKEENASALNMKKQIKESSTKVILERMQKEKKRHKLQKKTTILMGSIMITGLLIMSVRMISRVILESNKEKPVVITQDDANENHSAESGKETGAGAADETGGQAGAVTQEDLQSYRQQLYEIINQERSSAAHINETYENAAAACVGNCVNDGYATAEEWNQAIITYATDALADAGIQNTGWVVQPYASNFSISQVAEDMKGQIQANNQGIDNALDLQNCSEIGVAVGVHSDGTFFWMLIYR